VAREQRNAQLVVVGAGPGGYAAAFRAADLGVKVTLVDPEPDPGGVCLYRGCIPSKAYLHVARLLRETRDAAEWGVRFQPPAIDVDRLRAWKDEVVSKMTRGLGQLSKARGVEYVRGRGVLLDAHTLRIDREEPAAVELRFENAILATGSRPATPSALHLDSPRVLNSTEALALAGVPERLLVVGGGYIGLEMGTVYAELGSRVTVVEMTKSLLPGVDADLVRVLARSVAERFERVALETRVESLGEDDDGVRAVLAGADGQTEERFSKVLIAVGRKPNSSGIGLDATRVEVDDRGFVVVDAARRTAEPSIYAIGDLTGEPMLAHKATHEGIAAAQAIAGRRAEFDPRAIPAVVFTDPEIAWCGLTEAEAAAAGREVATARYPWQASGRAATLGRGDGTTKLVVEPETERVLGVGIVGPGAGELIAEGVLAVEMGASARDLASTIHPHPTLSETLMEAAEVFYGQSVHYAGRRRR
jgi:dihydrolipoamide dehydrogenase